MRGDRGERGSLFVFLRSEALPRLGYRSRPFHVSAGSEIVRQGERADEIHMIVEGRARIERVEPGSGRPLLLGQLGPGDLIGEAAVLASARFDHTVRAETAVRTLHISRRNVLTALLDVPRIPDRLRSLAERRLADVEPAAPAGLERVA